MFISENKVRVVTVFTKDGGGKVGMLNASPSFFHDSRETQLLQPAWSLPPVNASTEL